MENKNTEIVKYDLSQPDKLMAFAAPLAKFVKDKQLYTKIDKNIHVHVEGWQFAGLNMGLIPIITEVENLSTDKQKTKSIPNYEWKDGQRQRNGNKDIQVPDYKYRATCELRNVNNNTVISRGVMLCSNDERGKENFDEYAIMSMAETRAIGKAYRNSPVCVLIKCAGYSSTPAEEMSSVSNGEKEEKQDLTPAHEKWESAKKAWRDGSVTIKEIKAKYTLTEKHEKMLCS